MTLNFFLPIPCEFYHEKHRPTHFLGLNHLEENETREKVRGKMCSLEENPILRKKIQKACAFISLV